MKTWWKWCLVVLACLMSVGWVWAEEASSLPTGSPAPGPAKGAEPPAAVSSPTVSMEQTPHWSIIYLGAAASSGVIILGAAYGISKIGASAVESMARQPEAANSINTAMVVSAALIEGVTFLALIVCLLSVFFK
ncbi:MAG TPA: ATP synthase F0 subunit C [Thermoguttaceae bacterium]|nr:ATP synthase F0 subunit C [Thermoguttaceae bacterium]HPP53815.1 ATP synthase F0 subunit C [Thermoguttaceae bacterium]